MHHGAQGQRDAADRSAIAQRQDEGAAS